MYVRGYLQGSENGRVVTIAKTETRPSFYKADILMTLYYLSPFLYFNTPETIKTRHVLPFCTKFDISQYFFISDKKNYKDSCSFYSRVCLYYNIFPQIGYLWSCI